MEMDNYYQSNIKTSRKEDGVYVMGYANQQMLIDALQQENQQLKIQISAREEEYRELEDNWNELKEVIKKKFVAQGGFTSYEWNDLLNGLLDKMQEIERGVSDVEG